MRKLWKIFLLAGVLCAALCATALAADTTSGIYDAQPTAKYASTVTITPEGGTATQVQVGEETKTVYVGAEKMSLKFSGAVADNQYLVLALSGDSSTPTEDNIVYIDQNGTAEFTIYPSKLQNGTYHIYMAGTNMAYEEVASFSYYASYVLGDVDQDERVTSADASLILQYVAQLVQLEGNALDAAKVGNGQTVSSADASLILQYVAQLITEFPVEK